MIRQNPPQKVLYQVVKILDGTNADILYHDYPDGLRTVLARYGIKKGGFTLSKAQAMLTDINNYRKKLEQIGIPLPREDRSLLEYDPQMGKARIVRMINWVGEDVASVIRREKLNKNSPKIKKLVQGMCAIMARVVRHRLQGWAVRVGFDPHGSNFTLDNNGKIWFVDLFPPRYRKNGQPIIEWPTPKTKLGREVGYFKHYDARGIILCFLSQLSRANPNLKYFFEEQTIKYFRKVWKKREYEQFMEAYANLPWIKFRKILRGEKNKNSFLKLKELITKAVKLRIFGNVDYNIYNLRELAAELAAAGFINKQELENFFKASHFEDKLPVAKVTYLQNQLVNYLNRIYGQNR